MPIVPSITTTRLSQADFQPIASEVMRHVFDIHNEFGRFFDEQVYKREFATRMDGVLLETAVDVTHRSFTKRYFADALVHAGSLFEFKAAEAIHPRHTSQTIHYLLLFDLAHGKVINVRPEKVQHEFVNCHRRLADLRAPAVHDDDWSPETPGAARFRDTLMALIHDWGTGLEISLYEEGLIHFLGGEPAVDVAVPVLGSNGQIAVQRMRLVAPNVAFKLTAISDRRDAFLTHARRLIQHTTVAAIHWANITTNHVTFTTIR